MKEPKIPIKLSGIFDLTLDDDIPLSKVEEIQENITNKTLTLQDLLKLNPKISEKNLLFRVFS